MAHFGAPEARNGVPFFAMGFLVCRSTLEFHAEMPASAGLPARFGTGGPGACTSVEAIRSFRGISTAWHLRASSSVPGRKPIGVRDVRRRAERIAKRLDRMPHAVRRVVELISATEDRRLTLAQLSKVVDRSPSHLNVLFFQNTGLTIHQYAVFVRMTRAAWEIERGGKIEAIAMSLGYRSKKNFYRQFKEWFGVTPTSFRDASRLGRAPRTARSDTTIERK